MGPELHRQIYRSRTTPHLLPREEESLAAEGRFYIAEPPTPPPAAPERRTAPALRASTLRSAVDLFDGSGNHPLPFLGVEFVGVDPDQGVDVIAEVGGDLRDRDPGEDQHRPVGVAEAMQCGPLGQTGVGPFPGKAWMSLKRSS